MGTLSISGEEFNTNGGSVYPNMWEKCQVSTLILRGCLCSNSTCTNNSLERLCGPFYFTSFLHIFQLSVMKGSSCQVKRFCCFIGTNNVIDLTSLFLALGWSHNWQSPCYTRGDDFQGQDDNNQEHFFFFSKSLCSRWEVQHVESLEENCV